MMMIIYALFTQQSIGKLFAAGIIPGVLTAFTYAALIVFMVKRNPKLAPNTEMTSEHGKLPSRRKATMEMWPVAAIAFVVLGGLYSGAFTPTESAAAGALVSLGFAWYLKAFTKVAHVTDSMRDAANVKHAPSITKNAGNGDGTVVYNATRQRTYKFLHKNSRL